MHLKDGKPFFFTMPGHGQHTLTKEYGIFFYYTLHKFIGFIFYFELGHHKPKISSNRGSYNKKNRPAMTRGIESGHFQRKNLSFLNKSIILDLRSDWWIESLWSL